METWTIVGTVAAILLPIIAEFGGFTSLRKGVLLNYQTTRKRVMVLTDEVSDLLKRRETISNYDDGKPEIPTDRVSLLEYAKYSARMRNKRKVVDFLDSEIESTIRRIYGVLSETTVDFFLRFTAGIQILIVISWLIYVQVNWGIFGDLDEWASIANKVLVRASIGVSMVVIVTVDIRRWRQNKKLDEALDRETEKLKGKIPIADDEGGPRS